MTPYSESVVSISCERAETIIKVIERLRAELTAKNIAFLIKRADAAERELSELRATSRPPGDYCQICGKILESGGS